MGPSGHFLSCTVVVSIIFYFHPYLGKIPILTNIFQMGWNHQLGKIFWGSPRVGMHLKNLYQSNV